MTYMRTNQVNGRFIEKHG